MGQFYKTGISIVISLIYQLILEGKITKTQKVEKKWENVLQRRVFGVERRDGYHDKVDTLYFSMVKESNLYDLSKSLKESNIFQETDQKNGLETREFWNSTGDESVSCKDLRKQSTIFIWCNNQIIIVEVARNKVFGALDLILALQESII